MANSLLKNIAHNSFADAVYKEILSRGSKYYYFLGKTLVWSDEANPPIVIDSLSYEREVRNEIIAMKEITPADVSYILPRRDWATGIIYDEYDDQYSTEIQGLNISAGGSGYSVAPTITIGTAITNNISVGLNEQYSYGNFLYTVTVAGNTGSSVTNLLGVIGTQYTVNTAKLICVGVKATASCAIGTSGVNNQKVISATMIVRGSGYSAAPIVTFSSGAAVATAVIKNGILGATKLEDSRYYVQNTNAVYVCISNNNKVASTVAPSGISSDYLTTGDGYVWKYVSSISVNNKFFTESYIPIDTANKNQYNVNGSITNIFIDNAGSGYLTASQVLPLSTTVDLGEKYYYNGYVYTVTTAGTTSASYGTVPTVGSYTNGAVFLCNGILTSFTITGDGTDALLTPLITDGKITSIQINNAGSGYTYINIAVNGAGTGAVISVAMLSGTNQYSKQAQTELTTIVGNICSIKMISGGYGYGTPTISFTGDGTGATATATVVGGVITAITIVNRGSNYNWATITITDTTGAGASCRAVISPYGGLGRDPINHLCCKSLMFFAKIGNNTNQGISVSNDYRQIGIIKEPIRYSDGYYLAANTATTCWKITATANIPVGIVADNEVTVSANSVNYRYRVVSVSGTDILVIPLDNGIPTSGMQFTKSAGISFIVSTVSPPTVNKYSGDMLFIDNEPSFVATTTSPSVLRTVINF